MGRSVLNLLNQRFGKLLVVEFVGICDGYATWRCECDCGNERILTTSTLNQRGETSCGCGIKRFSKPIGESASKALFTDYRSEARRKGREFALSLEQFRELIQGNCYYCRIEPFVVYRDDRYIGPFRYNGIDRRENAIGYIFDNCVSCCKHCNRAKLDRSEEEFLVWITRVFIKTSRKNMKELAI